MNTRAIIQLLEDGVQITEEIHTRNLGLRQTELRFYNYSLMSYSSFHRLVSLADSPMATIKLIPVWIHRSVRILFYWKREGRRVYHGRA